MKFELFSKQWMDFYTVNMPSGCVECHYGIRLSGHSQVTINKKLTATHRAMYALKNGDIPEGMLVRHTCDNPCCINPEHLLVGTHKDNMNDRDNRGRNARIISRSAPRLSISQKMHSEVVGRLMATKGDVSGTASLFNVHESVVARIDRHLDWFSRRGELIARAVKAEKEKIKQETGEKLMARNETLASFKTRQAETFSAQRLKGLKFEHIADNAGCTVRTVYNRLKEFGYNNDGTKKGENE